MKARRRRRPAERPLAGLSTHFTKEGRPKTAYRTEAEAKQAAQTSWAINRVDLQTYRCDQCHQWHNGKPYSRN